MVNRYFPLHHVITNVKKLPSIVIKWHYIEKREWLPIPLLAGNAGTCNDKGFLNFRMCKRPGKDDIRTSQEWANFMRCNGNASPREFRDGIFIQYNQHSIINHDVSVVGWGVEIGTKYWVMRDSWGNHGKKRIGSSCQQVQRIVAKETTTTLELKKTMREVCLSCHDLISTSTKEGMNSNRVMQLC